jgi:Protein of unknown function (DUF3105)
MSRTQTKNGGRGAPPKGGGGLAKGGGGLAGGLTRRQRRRLVGVALGLAVILLVAGAGVWYQKMRPAPGDLVPDLGNDHIATPETPHVPYNSVPPTSGPHLPNIAPWGVWDRPIPRELQVHNLEDGGVVINYNPDCADRAAEPLKQVVKRYADHVLLSPYPGLDRCIALTAWTRIDKLEAFDEGRVVRFIEAYRGIDHHKR